mmetsp:Transcript_57716/g.137339  ORF Transcript_57716/g.137339 Transcript_57716/m.137339 type:complete len:767 (-) Transcript_57716:185-2485(-)|eukprot:CAMPEP_0178412958 /NCGR_PEP_ID=MMETSP0689_2-20121128/22283_1 /TAXON_ID=160604 /ORGANISM="Amphidinium massartii, Strain CS-259" /LENGTH=766 /DNA_ID=CAMNT_0020034221 /DNA_START=71 /DNA_END=2371 /DNA_ORIENTATION=+
MGNGALRRYRSNPTDGYDPNVWRKPNPKKKADDVSSSASLKGSQQPPPVKTAPSTSTVGDGVAAKKVAGGPGPVRADSSPPSRPGPQAGKTMVSQAQALQAAHATWSKPPPSPVAAAGEDDDDELLTDCSNLADAANKVWEELLARKNNSRGDFNALFCMHEMKDGVERAAKRVEHLDKEVADLLLKQEDKKKALDDCCASIEEKATGGGPAVPWKLGDLAVRRGGKGICEIAMVHHEADPPYFEVRMHLTASVVGTEAEKLIPLTAPQQATARKAIRDLELAKAEHAKAEDALSAAQEELKQQHQALTAQVEQKFKDDAAATSKGGVPGPPLPGVMAPSGLPDFDVFRKWVGPPGASGTSATGGATKPSQDYPEVKGVKEDLRSPGGSPPSNGPASSRPSPAHSNPAAKDAPSGGATSQKPQQAQAQPGNAGTRSSPDGFPTMDDLNRMGQQQQAGRPGAHPASSASAANPNTYRNKTGASAASFRGSANVPKVHQASNPQQQQQMPPAEWVAYSTVEGKQYYHNPKTGETVWELPPGARATYPNQPAYYTASGQTVGQGTSTADESFGSRPQRAAAAGGTDDDPFADLRHQEEENQKQREEWSQWYAQYCNWYSSQAKTGQAAAAGAAQANNKQPNSGTQAGGARAKGSAAGANTSQNAQNAGSQDNKQSQSSNTNLPPPRGPPPPKLDAGFEDKAMYAVKSAILKEMESMVAQGAAVAQRKKALRVLQMRWHPDKNPDRIEVAKSIFQFLEETKPWFLHEAEG